MASQTATSAAHRGTEIMQERVWIPGPRGRLCGELAYPAGGAGGAGGACLLVNPHPLMGGRMDNNIIAYLSLRLAGAGLIALRFDYGGVGASDGPAADIAGSMDAFWATNRAPEDPLYVADARAAWDWLTAQAVAPLALAGYSFGAWAATRLAAEAPAPLAPAAVVLVSPTIGRHDFGATAAVACPLMVVHGEGDFATAPGEFEAWRAGPGRRAHVVAVPGGNHFFRGAESLVGDACAAFLVPTLAALLAPGADADDVSLEGELA